MLSGKPLYIACLFAAVILGLSNSSLHPTSGNGGYTGAPGDSSCGACHSGSNPNLDGDVTIDGLPSTIQTGETYTLTVTVTNPNGNAVRAGFQMVALTGTNTNAGSMSNPAANTQIRIAGGKNYFGHSPAQNFPSSNTLSFDVDWTAPATAGSVPVIKFYATSVIANGANGNSNDRVVFTNIQVPIQSAPAPLALTLTNVEGVSCFGLSNGSATANATGGTPPYTYSWNNGETTAVNLFLPAGTATVTVTDNDGNTLSAGATIPSPPQNTSTTTGSAICEDGVNGTASVTASGGTGTKSYIWSNGATGNTISGLSPGVYTVTVEDANGCTGTNSAAVGIVPDPVFTGVVTPVSCHNGSNGSIAITVQSPPSGLSYIWSNGGTTASLTNVAAGSFQLTVTNATGCSSTAAFTVSQPTPLLASTLVSQPVLCAGGNNGVGSASASGGTGPYQYIWSNGSTGQGASHSISGLNAGTYSVTISDSQGCTSLASLTITEPLPLVPQVIEADTFLCQGEANGFIEAGSTGGTAPYQYLWSGGSTQQRIENLAAGNYSVIATDANQCSVTAFFSVEASSLDIDTILITPPTGNATNDGILEVYATGLPPLSYQWLKDGIVIDTDSIVTNAGPGIYSVIITETSGCTTGVDSLVLSAPSGLTSVLNVKWHIYPIPATDVLYIHGSGELPVDYIQLTDVQGRTVRSERFYGNKQEASQLDLSGLAAGSYVLVIVSGPYVWAERVEILAR